MVQKSELNVRCCVPQAYPVQNKMNQCVIFEAVILVTVKIDSYNRFYEISSLTYVKPIIGNLEHVKW